MIQEIKQLVPQSLRNTLRHFFHKTGNPRPINLQGNWELDMTVPPESKDAFWESVTMGTIDFPVKTPYANILLCAQPKSASLYIVQLLSFCLGFRNYQIGFDKGGGLIYYPRLLAAKFTGENTISHCHAEPTLAVLKMIKTLDLKPIILTRNLLDALVSRRDMLLRDKRAYNILSKHAVNDFVAGSHEYQMDVIIDLFASTYMNFFAGWEQYRDEPALCPIYMTYQELIDDEVGLVQRVAAELHIPLSRSTIEDVSLKISNAGGINFSTGVVGRGKDAFTKQQIAVLRNKALIVGCRDEKFLGFDFGKQKGALDMD